MRLNVHCSQIMSWVAASACFLSAAAPSANASSFTPGNLVVGGGGGGTSAW